MSSKSCLLIGGGLFAINALVLIAMTERAVTPERIVPPVRARPDKLESALSASPSALDVGKLVIGERGIGSFIIENKFAHAVAVTEIDQACGCTTVDIERSRLPLTIAAGESLDVQATVHATGRRGSYSFPIRFLCKPIGGGLTSKLEVDIAAEVLPQWQASDSNLKFGEIDSLAETQKTVSYTPLNGLTTLPLGSVVSSSPFFTAQAVQTDAGGVEVKVTKTVDSPGGTLKGLITVFFRGITENSHTFKVSCDSKGVCSSIPESMNVTDEAALEVEIKRRSTSNTKPLQLLGAECDGTAIAFESSPVNDDRIQMIFSQSAIREIDGSHDGILVRTNDGDLFLPVVY